MKKSKMKTTGIIIIVLLIFGAFIGIYLLNKQPIVCTEDAKICPDGTAVGRISPDCEFEACPVSKVCEIDADCVVFGEDGDCNCGCYNKDALPTSTGGKCFCAAPTSCECIDTQCEGIFG